MLRLCTVYNPRTLFAKPHVERIKLRSAIFSMKVGIPTSQPSIDSSLSWNWFGCLLMIEASSVCLTKRFWSLPPEPVGAGQNAEQVISISGTAEARICQMVGWRCTSNGLHFWDRHTRNRCRHAFTEFSSTPLKFWLYVGCSSCRIWSLFASWGQQK